MYAPITKETLLLILTAGDLAEDLKRYNPIDVIWAANELAKDRDLTPDKRAYEAMRIVRYYKDNPDPGPSDQNDRDLRANKEVRSISTVRGTLCWMLQNIITTLETAYYSEIITILEEYSRDSNLYLRQQVAIPLQILAANMRAIKNQDGTLFDFGAENRKRTEALIFYMIKDNRAHPRILEYLAHSFDRMRYLGEVQAQECLELFIYASNGVYNPTYVIENILPALIYFTEFKNPAFNNSWFRSLLKKILRESDVEVAGRAAWLFWKVCEEDIIFFERLKPYILILCGRTPDHYLLSRLAYLAEKVIERFPNDSIEILESTLRSFKARSGNDIFVNGLAVLYDDDFINKLRGQSEMTLLSLRKEVQRLRGMGIALGGLEKIL